MGGLTDSQDAYGHAMCDFYRGQGGYEVDERDDGFVGVAAGLAAYFAEYRDWPPHQKKAIGLARGKVVDIGCGAGRAALYLQQKGLDVLGIDISPLAIKVCKLRGLRRARVMSITRLSRKVGTFDSILMYGNNFGLFGSFKRAGWLLRRFHSMTSEKARIIAESNDPYQTTDPCHRKYHARNRERGRMGGQVRLRVRYKTYATPWFDYLLVSRDEMRRILDGTGWRVGRFVDSAGSAYVAVIEKES